MVNEWNGIEIIRQRYKPYTPLAGIHSTRPSFDEDWVTVQAVVSTALTIILLHQWEKLPPHT